MSQKKDKEKILFFRESVFKVAEAIFNEPNATFHIRKLSKELSISTTAVQSAIDELEKYVIITVTKTELITAIKANLESDAYLFYKKVFNLYRLQRYLIVEDIKKAYRPEAIVLFGSYAKGEDIERSDIDILVLSTKKNIDLSKNISLWENVLKRNVNIHVLPSLKKSYKEFKNTIANGIVLYGYITVVS